MVGQSGLDLLMPYVERITSISATKRLKPNETVNLSNGANKIAN